jgi:2,5-diketo-D-gluconate reductase A
MPAVNQIETHSFFQQPKTYEVLKQNGVRMEAWSPLAQGRNRLFKNKTLAEIGKKHNKSNAQVSLRWHYQRALLLFQEHLKKHT